MKICIINNKSNTKTQTIEYILQKYNTEHGMVISDDKQAIHNYIKFVDLSCIHVEFSSELLSRIIQRQSLMLNIKCLQSSIFVILDVSSTVDLFENTYFLNIFNNVDYYQILPLIVVLSANENLTKILEKFDQVFEIS